MFSTHATLSNSARTRPLLLALPNKALTAIASLCAKGKFEGKPCSVTVDVDTESPEKIRSATLSLHSGHAPVASIYEEESKSQESMGVSVVKFTSGT